jgi:hypothetical protein
MKLAIFTQTFDMCKVGSSTVVNKGYKKSNKSFDEIVSRHIEVGHWEQVKAF